jgi:hypothetical protein
VSFGKVTVAYSLAWLTDSLERLKGASDLGCLSILVLSY